MDKWCSSCTHFQRTGKWKGICAKGILKGELWSQTATFAQTCKEFVDKYSRIKLREAIKAVADRHWGGDSC